jgi:hypothetical protein
MDRYNCRVSGPVAPKPAAGAPSRYEFHMAGEHLDLTEGVSERHRTDGCQNSGRRFVGVHFVCCDVYTRIYINRDATAYEGNCPKCAKRVKLRIGPGGTDARFFTAG